MIHTIYGIRWYNIGPCVSHVPDSMVLVQAIVCANHTWGTWSGSFRCKMHQRSCEYFCSNLLLFGFLQCLSGPQATLFSKVGREIWPGSFHGVTAWLTKEALAVSTFTSDLASQHSQLGWSYSTGHGMIFFLGRTVSLSRCVVGWSWDKPPKQLYRCFQDCCSSGASMLSGCWCSLCGHKRPEPPPAQRFGRSRVKNIHTLHTYVQIQIHYILVNHNGWCPCPSESC